MAAPRQNEYFVDSIQILLKLLNDIERKKIVAERSCKGYKNLFKPWSLVDVEDTNSTENKNSEPTVEDPLSIAEKKELELVNKLLTKAEKAYMIKEKLSEPKRLQNKNVSRSSKETKIEENKSGNQSVETIKQENHDDNSESHISEERSKYDQTYKISQKQKELTVNTTSAKGQIEPDKSVVTEKDKGKSAVNSRLKPHAEIRKQKLSQPHIKAPFQTNTSIPFPKKSTSITKLAPQKIPSSASRFKQDSRNNILVASKSRQNIPKTTSKEISSDVQSQENDKDHKMKEGLAVLNSEEKDIHDYVQSDACVEKVNQSDKSLNMTEGNEQDNRLHATDKISSSQMSQQKLSENKSTEKTKFNLLTDGSHLTLPVKLRKYAANNRKLRQKYEMYRMTKKVSGVPLVEKIISDIESTFTDKEEWSLMKNIQDLTNIYHNLRKYLVSLDLKCISESSSAYELLRSRKALEMILSTFQHTEEQKNHLHTSCIEKADYIGTCIVEVTRPTSNRTNMWIPKVKDIQLPISPAVIQYRSVRQLHRYTSLLFQTQYCQFQSYIHEVFAQEILPFLKSVHPKSSEFISLLRSSFSLLTDDETFPVIVQDTIEELEESIVDS